MAVIWYVEDEQPLHRVVTRIFEKEGHQVVCFSTLAEILGAFRVLETTPTVRPDVVVTDCNLNPGNGEEVVEAAWLRTIRAIIMVSGDSINNQSIAKRLGVSFIEKPFNPALLVFAVEQLLNPTYNFPEGGRL